MEVQFNERLQVIGDYAFEYCTALRSVTLPSTVTELGRRAFEGCTNLTEVRFSEGLRVIGDYAFASCTALRNVFLPRTATYLGRWAFHYCTNLTEVRLNEGLQAIDERAFASCRALRSVTIPSTVTRLGQHAFVYCLNLLEVRFLNQQHFVHSLLDEEREDQRSPNHVSLNEIIHTGGNVVFCRCPSLATVKISTSWALSERIQRLPRECKLSLKERIRDLPCLELMQDGNVFACFPVVSSVSEAEDDSDSGSEYEYGIAFQDTNIETSRSLYQVLRWIAFHELKESSILIELAMWKSRIDGAMRVLREDCRAPIPDPVKLSIMEYCGFVGFLEPVIGY
ncbi:hypothetical protein THAOC_08179 [Thalassiosira oceanica]|uniref:Leucine-rich repeat domain-containing protein n=1 Tax=Thalassiosira oceanica TaxID=159749 RepID=K0TIS1_THAOC|nr:hypothetical protein THAOC_08179 [Thalassiosira oceanica]|eukprot:EJK70462.1 hypothetical protein THAOC_08179 [Thalassiosira oceanica]